MKKIFQHIFRNDNPEIPRIVEKNFKSLFKHANSIEWISSSNEYEALFYDKGIEKIARFSSNGSLIEVRVNHSPQDFDRFRLSPQYFESTIMNYIEINKEDSTFHELIIKQADFKRLLILLNNKYEIVKEEVL